MSDCDDDYADPRDIAYILERYALFERIKGGNQREAHVRISVELALKIAAHLRRAPLRKGRARQDMREMGVFNGLVAKARQTKARLVAKGMSATEAEAEAAGRLAGRWSAETIRRAMQHRR
jgi:hypothetical protein